MDESLKTTLDSYNDVLVHNVILTEEFYTKLMEYNVLTDAMIEDVKACDTRELANSKLLELLYLRGERHFADFVRVLSQTGHVLLGDQLRDEIDGTLKQFKTNPEDVATRLLFTKNLSPEDIKKLHRYIDSRVTKNVLLASFQSSSMERQRMRVTKANVSEHVAELRNQLMAQEDEKSKLTQELDNITKENDRLKEQISSFNKERAQIEKDYQKQLSTQQNFALAGNNEVIRMRERLTAFDCHVRSMNVKARCFFKPDDEEEIKKDPDNIRISLLEKNFDKVMTRINELNVIKENIRKELARQTKTFRELLLAGENVKPEDALRRYISSEYEGVIRATRQAIGLGNNIHSILTDVQIKSPKSLREHTADFQFENANTKRKSVDINKGDFEQLNKHLSLLYSDVDHVKCEWKSKDLQILDLQQENEKLRVELKVSQMYHVQLTNQHHPQGHVPNNLSPIPSRLTNGHPVAKREIADDTKDAEGGSDIYIKSDQSVNNVSLPPISSGSTKLNHVSMVNGSGEPVLIKTRRSLDPLDSLRSQRPDSPDPRSLSRISTRSDSSTHSKKVHIQTVSFPRDWNKE